MVSERDFAVPVASAAGWGPFFAAVAVGVHYPASSKKHFYSDHDEYAGHGDDACEGCVAFAEEPWEAGVGEAEECGWDEMYECRRDEYTGAEML